MVITSKFRWRSHWKFLRWVANISSLYFKKISLARVWSVGCRVVCLKHAMGKTDLPFIHKRDMNNISYSAYQLPLVAFQKLSVQPPVPLTGPMKGCISCSPSPTILLTIYNSWTTGTCPKQYAYQKLGLEKHYLWELAWRIFRPVISVPLSRSSE